MTWPAAGPRMTEEEFRLLSELVEEHCGIRFQAEMGFLLQRRLAPRLETLGLPDFATYHRFLRYDPGRRAELEAMVEALTTNETYFYREPQQLRAFSEEILPALAQERAAARRLRVWSAGCSTGEEVYTVAILLARSDLFRDWDVEVLGTDLARRVLAVARAGAYGPHAFRTAEAEALRPWFRAEGGKWVVKEVVRRLASFAHLNLLDGAMAGPAGEVDVLFCRNVLIYFGPETRRHVLRTFHRRLRPGGYLLLGHSESLVQITADFELVSLRNDLVYRKPPEPEP